MRSRTRNGIFAVVCGALIGCASTRQASTASQEPLSAVAPAELAEGAAARADEACKAAVRTQLTSGVARPGPCDASRSRAARRTIVRNRVRFGVVEHREVELHRVSLRLGDARLCRGWPLPLDADHGAVLYPRDARRSGCFVRPYSGSLTLTAVDARGQRQRALVLEVPSDGSVGFEYADVDAALRRETGQGLDAYTWLELGEGAWAGAINLERMRGFLADWHFVWVSRGRGSAALFAERHAAHARSRDAEAMALEAQLERQRQDFDAVSTGRMTASAFLDRHVWSPFRAAVEQLSLADAP